MKKLILAAIIMILAGEVVLFAYQQSWFQVFQPERFPDDTTSFAAPASGFHRIKGAWCSTWFLRKPADPKYQLVLTFFEDHFTATQEDDPTKVRSYKVTSYFLRDSFDHKVRMVWIKPEQGTVYLDYYVKDNLLLEAIDEQETVGIKFERCK
jgi:hypothetical protein